MKLIYILYALSFLINFYLFAKVIAQDNFITGQQLKIRKLEIRLRDWQRTHGKCIDSACMEKVLDDIIGDFK